MPRYIIAESARAALSTMEIDWGWKQTGNLTFRDLEGYEVRYVPDIRTLMYSSPAELYQGWNWFSRSQTDLDFLDMLLNTGRVKIVKSVVTRRI